MTYTWEVTYKDGSTLKQFSDGVEVSSEAIKAGDVVTAALKCGDQPVFTLHLAPDQKLLYRRRTAVRGLGKQVCHILGWRQRVGDITVQAINYCFEDGVVESCSDFKEDHPWFYSPKLRESEI